MINLLLAYLLINPAIGLNYDLKTDHCFVLKTGLSVALLNNVYQSEEPTDAEIEQIKSYFGATKFAWVVNSKDQQSINRLTDHGLSYQCSFPAMSMELNDLPSLTNSAEFNIKQVDFNNIEQITDCIELLATSFTLNIADTRGFVEFLHHTIKENHFFLYLGYYKEQPVSTGMLIVHDQVACIHSISTLPEFRKNGFASIMTHTILDEAKAKGCNQAFLLSSDVAKNVYSRLGFKQNCMYSIYGN